MADLQVEILDVNGYTVRWATEDAPEVPVGIVALTSARQAQTLKRFLEEGMAASRAIRATLIPLRGKRKKPGWSQLGKKFGKIGGKTRAANMTAKERRESAQRAAEARWGRKTK